MAVSMRDLDSAFQGAGQKPYPAVNYYIVLFQFIRLSF